MKKEAFDKLGFEKLIFANAVGNRASRKVKEKTGCTFIRTQPSEYVDPQFKQMELWGPKNKDWEVYKSTAGLKAGIK